MYASIQGITQTLAHGLAVFQQRIRGWEQSLNALQKLGISHPSV